MIDKDRNKIDQCHCYKLQQWGRERSFDNFNDLSENATLFQLVYTVVNVDNAVSIAGSWVYGSNYEIVFPSIK